MNIQQLKALRERLGISQAKVARVADMNRFKLSLAECGHIDLRGEDLKAIERFLARVSDPVQQVSRGLEA
jgi:predicted transcriptional regulator